MKLSIIGSRSFNDYDLLKKSLNGLIISEIVSGGAIGADSLAELYAKENNIPTKIFLPDWKSFGKAAGIIRNKEIISYCDSCIAFWDGKSKGTLSSINLCKKLNKYLKVINF